MGSRPPGHEEVLKLLRRFQGTSLLTVTTMDTINERPSRSSYECREALARSRISEIDSTTTDAKEAETTYFEEIVVLSGFGDY
jgi:hypothetical protein